MKPKEITARALVYRQERDALLAAIPHFNAGIAKRIRTYALKIGFKKAELDGLIDHRAIVVLYHAMLLCPLNKRRKKRKAK